ncbi:MAG TPA: hypothetical protein PKE29_02755 [Phycisphaerales bacterium]|nr:hypothetical protein [Phycisphaerales bacterium]
MGPLALGLNRRRHPHGLDLGENCVSGRPSVMLDCHPPIHHVELNARNALHPTECSAQNFLLGCAVEFADFDGGAIGTTRHLSVPIGVHFLCFLSSRHRFRAEKKQIVPPVTATTAAYMLIAMCPYSR